MSLAVPRERSLSASRDYIQNAGLTGLVAPVSGALLTEMGLNATPTILSYDNTGVVTGSWVGKLNEDQEKEVTSFLESRRRTP